MINLRYMNSQYLLPHIACEPGTEDKTLVTQKPLLLRVDLEGT